MHLELETKLTMQKENKLNLLAALAKGVGQVMLQENVWTGLLFLAGIFCGSVNMGIAAVLAVIVGTCTAKILHYDTAEIKAGLYGFSATLVGVALACMFQSGLVLWISILLGSALAAIIQHFFIVRKIPAFTFPFIVVTWILLFLFAQFPHLVVPQSGGSLAGDEPVFVVLARGYGQVIFQDSLWAGILFFIGVLICNPIAAVYGLVGAAISATLAYLLREPLPNIYLGLMSFNAVLCAITFAGKNWKDAGLALMAVVLSLLISMMMRGLHLPVLTFPFVLASWMTLSLKMLRS